MYIYIYIRGGGWLYLTTYHYGIFGFFFFLLIYTFNFYDFVTGFFYFDVLSSVSREILQFNPDNINSVIEFPKL